ncbi:MAG: peptidoglycan-binding protein [Clostridia bacterium]|nr:peptidoglycan-binding protein [Clostridia bacterium]
MPTGNIVFVLRTASGALPINNGSITVKSESGETVFYEFLTSANSGLSRTATLETPPRSISLDSDEGTQRPYSIYNVSIRAEGNYRMEIDGIQMFEGETTQLPIDLIPLPEGVSSPESAEIIIIRIPEHILRATPNASGQQSPPIPNLPNNATNSDNAIPTVNIGTGVYIPETITVHLGAPDENAPNVSVSFIDYIKNVASSEVYPTWPRESLEANILAQISLSLNRIYTEWYRSQGYDFDITNSTAFDQAYVYGRNIFDEMSVIVDEIFNRYLVRPNSVAPLFASYCNGTTSTCAGLSQWGTVALAESGQSTEEILGFYYGDVIITETNDIRAPEESYPGTPLSTGDSGEDVRIIQEQLNRIAINFPQVPLIEVNGVYDESTVNTVREFQRLFILPISGVVDKATWYRISQIYASVKRLAEITSEGQRAAYNQQLYPGTPLKVNSRGSEVQEIQFYLQRINRFNPTVESPELDGIYGADTRRAVISFQNAYGLVPSGEVDETVWNRLVEVYNGTLDNVDEPQTGITPIPFPGYVLSPGATGEYPRYIQEVLNIINNVFLIIPELAEDGIYGSATQSAVNVFASIFGYPQNGTVDESLWNKINQIYSVVQANCIFSTGESEGARGFSGTELTIGSSGENVSYIQERINRINTAIPYIPALTVDGLYGSATRNSVSSLQRLFGLTETGNVNENTWLLVNYIYAAVVNGCLPSAQTASIDNSISVFKHETETERNISVSELKELMRINGINVGNGPMFGLKSRRALAYWQSMQGLEPTGLPDVSTRSLLAKNAKHR